MLMGTDYTVVGFDMEVQPFVTPMQPDLYVVSAVRIDIVCSHKLLAQMPLECYWHSMRYTGHKHVLSIDMKSREMLQYCSAGF